MPAYPWLLHDDLPFDEIQRKVDVMAMLGVPYGDAVLHAESLAREQSLSVAASIAKQGGPEHLENKKIVALVAYLQRLGTDLHKKAPNAAPGGAIARGPSPRSNP